MSTSSTKGNAGRRPVSTPDAVEEVAMRLWLERGYDGVSVEEIAAAVGIGRTTFFRYFGTKSAVVWSGFDRALVELEVSLKASEDPDTMAAIRSAVEASVHAGTDDRGVWWERFVLLDSVPSLRAGAADRWHQWVTTVATFLADRMGVGADHPFAVAIASAHQGVYVATLRGWEGRPGDPDQMLQRMMASLEVVGDEMTGLLTQPLPDVIPHAPTRVHNR